MVNVPATISFFVIAALMISVAVIMAWRTHRKNKAQAKAKAEIGAEAHDESYHIVHNAGQDVDDGERQRMPEYHKQGWRWKRILQRVGWIRVPSDDDGQEMRDMGKRGAVVEERAGEVIIAYERSRMGLETDTVIAAAAEGKLPRPTDVPSFENLGGYRYGDFAYGSDNMSPLPVLAPVSVSVSASSSISDGRRHHHHHHHHQSPSSTQGIAKVEGVSLSSSSSLTGGGKISLKSSHATYPLTSYNGFPTTSQDDIMAALPIPKDHPLSQHHPMGRQRAVPPLPKPRARLSQDEEVHETDRKLDEEGRNLPEEERILREYNFQKPNLQEPNLRQEGHQTSIFQYERESLVPAPLDPRRGRHNLAARRRSNAQDSRVWTSQAGQTKVVKRAGPLPAPSRPHSCCISVFGSPAPAGARSRYSHFENPLRQHPVEGEAGERALSEVQAQLRHYERAAQGLPSDQPEEEKGAVEPKLPSATGRRRMRYTFAFDAPLVPAEVPAPRPQDEDVQNEVTQFEGQDGDIPPRCLQAEGEATKTPKETMVRPLSHEGNEFKAAFQISDNKLSPPIPVRFGARPVTAPPEFLARGAGRPAESTRQEVAHPLVLQIGRRPAALAQQNRHFSVFDGTWTIVPLSPVGRSPGKPMRWSGTAE
ncbi:hypothetical protein PV04_10485 [Phialophora macrospora]|uniref:Uncharacterized protein n=1 Tax=Phialophora macrospora TaxID=1851006 RepID=A0A0D2CBC7_9EURO|nr:hypothetical protein PV04_10485 [Phialophora macrospora]